MPRYFFHIRDGDGRISDEEGQFHHTLSAAHAEAVASARDIVAEKVRAGEVVDGEVIDIADEHGTILDTLPLRSVLRLPS